jgi:diguanylate cyclase (GGDEF)-like protein/PAS domain S-box-containing protein
MVQWLRAGDTTSSDPGFTILPAADRLEFERLFLYLRLCFLGAPLLLIAAYGRAALSPAIQAEIAIAVDCMTVACLLRWSPVTALRAQMLTRAMDITVAYIALHVVHSFQHNAYYDSVYLFFVVAATATHGRRGTTVIATISTGAVLLGRLQLMAQGAFPFELRHITDAGFYALLFFTTGAITDFLMQQSAEAVAVRDKEAREAIQRSEMRYRELFENLTDIVYEHDVDGRFTVMNRQGLEVLGYEIGEMLRLSLLDIVHPDYRDEARGLIKGQGVDDGGRHHELVFVARDGTNVPVEISSRPLHDARGTTVQGIARDITERKYMENQLRHQALHDALTGLPNRFLFEDRLSSTANASRRSGDTAALLLVDLDRFKAVNDTHGHAVGDALLRNKAASMSALLRESDTVARIGGDEFALLLPHTDVEGAVQVATKLIDVATQPVRIGSKTVSVGASIGIAIYPHHASNTSALKESADRAMYEAKRGGVGYAVAPTGPEAATAEPVA